MQFDLAFTTEILIKNRLETGQERRASHRVFGFSESIPSATWFRFIIRVENEKKKCYFHPSKFTFIIYFLHVAFTLYWLLL